MYEAEKSRTLKLVANGFGFTKISSSKYKVRDLVVHARFCRTQSGHPGKYRFNINPSTFSSDYQVWICGHPERFYLIPARILWDLYSAPNAYIDRTHPEISVVNIDFFAHIVTYATQGRKKKLKEYYRSVLPPVETPLSSGAEANNGNGRVEELFQIRA